MGIRRQARESALQMLYQIEVSGHQPEEMKKEFWARQEMADVKLKEFSESLVDGVLAQKETIDGLISQNATHWRLNRMPVVDRNLLRLAVFELKECKDVPLKVILNEAIEIAKKFGSEESHTFINGVLDKVAKELRKE